MGETRRRPGSRRRPDSRDRNRQGDNGPRGERRRLHRQAASTREDTRPATQDAAMHHGQG